MFQVAMLSKWHVHAGDYARQIRENPLAEITCVWDEDEARGKAWAQELGVPFEGDLDQLLARKDVQGVCVDTPTNLHKDVITRAAKAGKHIFTEKVLAFTTADAKEMAATIDRAGVKFCISYPHRTWPSMRFIKQAVEDGLVGDVSFMRVRNVHGGALLNWLPDYWYDPKTTGGGAMMDLGAHPMYLARWILGAPKRMVSMFNNLTPRPVEDNAVCTIEFEGGALAVVETSLVSPYAKRMVEIYGSKGAIISENDKVQIITENGSPVAGWVTPAKLPEALPKPIDMWIAGVVKNEPIAFGTKEAVELSELMELAYIAHEGRREATPEK